MTVNTLVKQRNLVFVLRSSDTTGHDILFKRVTTAMIWYCLPQKEKADISQALLKHFPSCLVNLVVEQLDITWTLWLSYLFQIQEQVIIWESHLRKLELESVSVHHWTGPIPSTEVGFERILRRCEMHVLKPESALSLKFHYEPGFPRGMKEFPLELFHPSENVSFEAQLTSYLSLCL